MLFPKQLTCHHHRHHNHHRANPFLPFAYHHFRPNLAPIKPPTAITKPISQIGRPAMIKKVSAAKLEVKFSTLVRAVASTSEKCPIATKQTVKIEPVPGQRSRHRNPHCHLRLEQTWHLRSSVCREKIHALVVRAGNTVRSG